MTFVFHFVFYAAIGSAGGVAWAQNALPPPSQAGVGTAAEPQVQQGEGAAASDKEKEVLADLQAGAAAVGQLDLAAAQGYFEQAFARCDTAGIKGPTLAKVYMALGSLYVGYLQQVPQGTSFLKLAFQNDPKVEPLREVNNSQVVAAIQMVRESLGLVEPAEPAKEQGPPARNSLGGFWVVRHERVEQAKRLFPLGLWVETNPMVAVNGVRLYFRTPSDRQFTVGMMQKKGSQWGLLIDCSAIALLDPEKLFYYYEVIGGDNSVIAHEGTAAEPMVIDMVPEAEFQGRQPMLPGMPEPEKCDPDEAAPCPPWDPHCKDVACVSSEDCVAGKICHQGYCIETETAEEQGEGWKALGLVIAGGVGMGAGFVSGTEHGFCGDGTCYDSIDLDSGLSPSWMFTRAMLGYYLRDNIMLGLWVRFQHLNDESMKIARLQVDDKLNPADGQYDELRGPMWGLTASLFLYGDGRWMGPGQVKDDLGHLKDKQGFRLYSRLEFDVYGAMYHEVTLHPDFQNVSLDDGGNCSEAGGRKCYSSTEKRQHVSGMNGVGLGAGALFGVHRNIDIAAELMYDLLFPNVANNFDLQLGLQFHF